MNIVDTSKARAFAEYCGRAVDTQAALWINELADEVDSQAHTIDELRAMVADVEAESAKTQDERDAAIAALQELYDRIGAMLREANHLAANHPDPAAAGAAMRILGRF